VTDQPPAGPEPEAPEAQDSPTVFARNTLVMSAGTALSRLTGFLRLSAMAFAIGVAESKLADIYTVANTTPNIVYELALGAVLSSVFVPVFVEWLERHGREAAWDVARDVMTIALVVLGALTVVGIVLAPWIVKLYLAGYEAPNKAEAEALATYFLRWFMPQVVFYGIGAVATGLLNSHRRFAAPMFAPVLNNLTVIATFLVFTLLPGPETGTGITTAQKLVLSIGTTLGVVAMTVALWPSLRRLGFRFRWRLDWRHPAVRRIAGLAKWALIYVVVNQIGYLVVIILSNSATDPGPYAAYTFAFTLFQLPYAIFSVSIMTALLPAMSSRWSDRDLDGFRGLLARGIRASAFVVLPAAAGYLVLAEPIVKLLLEHGVFGGASTELVSSVLLFFSLGLVSFSTFQLLLRAFYAMQDSRTPALINIGSVALNTVVNLALFPVLGVRGLALGHVVAYTFASVVAVVLIRPRIGGLEGREVARGLIRVAVAGALTALAAWGASQGIAGIVDTSTTGGQLVQVVGALLAGLLVFVATALVLRMEELELLRGVLRRRVRGPR
jgi:putative peptidoglycan lipid II flippase